MSKWKIAIVLIALLIMLAQHGIAGEKFFIYVYDRNQQLTPDASVEISIASDLIEKGFTDSDGRYESWLDVNTLYKIVAQKDGQSGDWIRYPDINNRRIEIHMS